MYICTYACVFVCIRLFLPLLTYSIPSFEVLLYETDFSLSHRREETSALVNKGEKFFVNTLILLVSFIVLHIACSLITFYCLVKCGRNYNVSYRLGCVCVWAAHIGFFCRNGFNFSLISYLNTSSICMNDVLFSGMR